MFMDVVLERQGCLKSGIAVRYHIQQTSQVRHSNRVVEKHGVYCIGQSTVLPILFCGKGISKRLLSICRSFTQCLCKWRLSTCSYLHQCSGKWSRSICGYPQPCTQCCQRTVISSNVLINSCYQCAP